MQAPTRLAFYGYDGDDWNTNDAATPNINTRWKPIDYCFVDGNVDAALANPDLIPEESWYKNGTLIDARGTDQNGQTHDVILRLAPDKPYRYIMMRVYDATPNPWAGGGYNGHIGSYNNEYPDYDNIVTDRVDGIGYMSNFDLAELKVAINFEKFTKLGFTHTHGALSGLNDDAWGYENAPINEVNNWTDPAAAGIAERYGVQFPDFNYVGKTATLQATHEREYDVYVIPGHTVALIPYSDMHATAAYGDGYIRWFDYATDLAVDDKYFGYHVNPSLMWQIPANTESSTTGTKVGGSLGGVDLLRQFQSRTGLGGAVPSADMARGCFAQFHVPAGEEDFKGATVAADFSMSWGDDRTQVTAGRIARANGMIDENDDYISVIEPAVNCRSVFHIHDGREFARNLSASAENNKEFINQHRRVVSAAPGKDFNIRLEYKEPAAGGYHSNIYYLTADDKYERVCRFLERTFIGDAEQPDAPFVIDNGKLAEGGPVVINQMGYITEDAGKPFNRFLHCEPDVAVGGTTYTVKIYGLDEAGNLIRTATGNADLQIMEYVITFEREGDVSMQEMTDYLRNLDGKGQLLDNPDAANLPRHTYQSLEQRFGETYSMQTYDQYMLLANALRAQGRDINDYFVHPYGTDGGKGFVNRMGLNFRYPIMWERCDYTFPYTVEEGWNHYSISNHSEMTSYKAGAGRHNYRGLLDVSFYMKHPLLYGKSSQQTLEPDFDYATHDFSDAGFFFFADAATDPGTVSRVVVEKPCPGTRIHVSAWVSEFGDSHNGTGVGGSIVEGGAQYTDGNWANVIFNFRAKNKETGEQKTIYTYVPGKVPDFGYWYHIYFSFIPVISDELADTDKWDYYISLESNAPSSFGADFAVDDIRIYLQKPDVNLIQLAPLCDRIDADGNKVENENVRILVEVPFEMLVRATGLTDAEEADFYFCAIDKDAYEANGGNKDKSIIPIENSGSGFPQYGKMTFDVNYANLPDYEIEETDTPVAMKKVNDFGEECMYFFFTVKGDAVDVGKEIKFCVYAQPTGTDNNIENPLDLFQVDDACAIHSELRLQGAAIIKMDGVAVADRNNIVCCENQRPVIQLTMTAKPAEGQNVEDKYTPEVVDAYYDWFDGEYKDLVAAGLEEALSIFRQEYPLAETYDLE
ncbi:MAG: hypothetical protein K2K69_10975, partial [Muribaculaceae bacterium]|nr:hypothetical protein [Muribaculaceae bacterium]